jgi:hypothetical protein
MVEAMMIVFGGFHDDSVDEGPIDGDSSDNELNGGDFLSQLVPHTEMELLIGNTKGLKNFKTVKKSAEENVYK